MVSSWKRDTILIISKACIVETRKQFLVAFNLKLWERFLFDNHAFLAVWPKALYHLCSGYFSVYSFAKLVGSQFLMYHTTTKGNFIIVVERH